MSPIFITAPQQTAAAIGSIATFTCAAVGIPPPTVQWFIGMELVGEEPVLMVTDVGKDKAGTYMCIVSNEAGQSTSSAQLTAFGNNTVIIGHNNA